jgi:hypothetical protein
MNPSIPQQSNRDRVCTSHSTLWVRDWSTPDADVVAAAEAAQERGERLDAWLSGMVRIGAIASTSASSSGDLRRLETAVDRLTGSLTTQVDTSLSRLQRAVEQAVDPETGPLGVSSESSPAPVHRSPSPSRRRSDRSSTVPWPRSSGPCRLSRRASPGLSPRTGRR